MESYVSKGGNQMKAKRLLSLVLVLCMAASMLPGLSFPAEAADSVEYVRFAGPELAIMNMYMGASGQFYESVYKDKRYNAVEAGKFAYGGTKLKFDDEASGNATFTWSGFADTNLALLSDQTQQLKVSYSTTLKNNFHKHKWWSGIIQYGQDVVGRTSAMIYFPGQASRGPNGPFYSAQYSDTSNQESARKGNQSFSELPSVFNGQHALVSMINGEYTDSWKRSDLKMQFTNKNYYYDSGSKTCTCGGSVIGNFVGFYDGQSPTVRSVEVRKNGVATTDFKPGDTVQVALQFSEPVRFADDSSTGKENIYIALLVNGSSSDPLFARLTRLESSGYYNYATSSTATWEAVFEYEIPTNAANLLNVTGINLSQAPEGKNALVLSDATIPMVQVIGDGSFTVTKPNDSDADGFTKSSSYITDLAGNPLTAACPAVNFSVDAEQPYVAQVVVNADMHNYQIKARKDPSEPRTDPSDTYLGVGDYIRLTVYLNEVVDFTSKWVNSSENLATATLNLLYANNEPVTVPLYWYFDVSSESLGSQYGLGASGGYVSMLKGSNLIWITDGMHLPEGEDTVCVTAIEYDPAQNVHDASGNLARDEVHVVSDPPVDHLAPTMSYFLDTEGPTVTVDPGVQSGVNAQFYVPFTVADGAGGSGVQSMVGSIRLTANGEKSAFQYAVTGSAATDSQTVWKDGHLGDWLSIVETGALQYLHVRQTANTVYDFDGLTATFELSDYAGNEARRTAEMTGICFDTVAPRTISGDAARAFDGANGYGVMTVPVTVKDTCGVDSAWYLWADEDQEITASNENWTALTFVQGVTEVNQDVQVVVQNGDSFQKTLWLMAVDMAGNVTVSKKASYSYNLEALHFELEYTTNVTTEAAIHYISMEQDDGFFLVDVHKKTDEDENGNATVHYINVGMQGGFAGGQTESDGFMGVNFGWHLASLEEDPVTHERTFTILDNDEHEDGVALWSSSDGGYGLDYYNGEIEVTIYSGTTQATLQGDHQTLKSYSSEYGIRWDYNGQTEPIVMDGSVSVEHITLRVVQENNNWINNRDEARIKCDFTYVDPRLHDMMIDHTDNIRFTSGGTEYSTSYAPDAFDYYGMKNTLGGIKVSFTLTDTFGWDMDDIDWENSYFRLSEDYTGDWWEDDPGAVRVCGIGSGATQTVVFPSTDIPAGQYRNIMLVIARRSAPSAPYWFYVTEADDPYADGVVLTVEVDPTEPGTLQPGLMSYQPYVKLFDTDHSIETEKTDAFPRQLIEYDANDVIYIPAGNTRVDLMFQALDANGDPAAHEGFADTLHSVSQLTYVTDRNFGLYDVVAWNTADPEGTLTVLQDESGNEGNDDYNPYYDDYDTDEFCFELDDEGNIVRVADGSERGLFCLTLNATGKNLVEDTYHGYSRQLALTPGVDNVIAVQMRYVNGQTSGIVYLTIHPVEVNEPQGTVTTEPAIGTELAGFPFGTLVGAPGEVAFRYTPAEGENTAGMSFYLCKGFYYFADKPIRDGGTYAHGEYLVENLAVNDPAEMIQQGDGSYWVQVPDYEEIYYEYGLVHYVVVAKDGMGNLFLLPSPTDTILLDSQGPLVDGDPELDVVDGSFTAEFTINDASLGACLVQKAIEKEQGKNYYGNVGIPSSAPMTLTFSVDDAYAALIGGSSFSVVYDPAEVYTTENVTYSNDYWTTTVVSSLPVNGNTLGISSVTATLTLENRPSMAFGMNIPSLTLTVNGSISTLLTDPTDVELTLAAIDCFGNASTVYDEDSMPSEVTTTLLDAVGVPPQFVSAEYKLTGNQTNGWQQDRALYLTFSGAVQPEASWICPDPQGYNTVWADGFPIWKDGEWEITYYDTCGIQYTETITLDDVFGDYGIDLDISTLDYSTEPIVLTAELEGPDGDGTRDCLALLPLPANLDGFEETYYGSSRASREVTENGAYVVLRAPYSGAYGYAFTDLGFRKDNTDYLIIHIDNYVDGRPEETLTFFFNDTMRGYNPPLAADRQGVTERPVTVSYRTGRPTQPVGSGETSKTFYAGDDDSFSFTYYDAATDAEYTISGRLSDYGVTLTEPAEPEEDTRAPMINRVTVWRQLGTSFEQVEAFRGDADEAEIAEVLGEDRTGWVSGYNLVFNASDPSPWRLVLCASEPTVLSYDTPNDDITGVALQGNNILISSALEAEQFWVAAVDAYGNFSSLRLQKSWLCFDDTAPTLTSSDVVVTGFIERVYYLQVSDDHSGIDRITVTGAFVEPNDGSNPDYPSDEYPYLIRFTDNTDEQGVPVTATDQVGNSTTVYFTMSGIDFAAPVFIVTWSPCFSDAAAGTVDEFSPPSNKVNVDVLAHITSSKSILSVEGEVVYRDPTDEYWESEEDLEDQFGSSETYYTLADRTITVYFTNSIMYNWNYGEEVPVSTDVTMHITAVNGAKADLDLYLAPGVVDRSAPYLFEENYYYLYHERPDGSDYDVAYACEVELIFDEDAYLISGDYAGRPDVLHSAYDPISYVVYDTDDHPMTVTDKAGNYVTWHIYDGYPEQIDNKAPVLSIVNEDALTPVTNTAVSVQVRVDDESGWDSYSVSDPSVVSIANAEVLTDPDTGDDYGLLTLSVSRNGTYSLTVIDMAGNARSMIFGVSNLDLTLPTIRFAKSTVSLRRGGTAAQLAALLDEGVVLWDNVDSEATLAGTLSYDSSDVNLNEVGFYTVVYTVTDSAGNVGYAERLVRVLSDKQPEIRVDGALTEAEGTLSLRPGDHVLSVSNLSNNEPYTVKLVKGIWSEGQLKYAGAGIAIDPDDGSFTLATSGFYTLYILTQSRVSYRTLLYADN